MSDLLVNFEEISFENLVYYYKNELEETHRTGNFPEGMTKYIRQKLRKYGILNVDKGQKNDLVYLTEKTLSILHLE